MRGRKDMLGRRTLKGSRECVMRKKLREFFCETVRGRVVEFEVGDVSSNSAGSTEDVFRALPQICLRFPV